jgi:hypothetical protein
MLRFKLNVAPIYSNLQMPMPASIVRHPRFATLPPWAAVLHHAVGDDPTTALDRMDVAFLRAVDADDSIAQAALAANALAFMLLDWSRFTHWKAWIERFDAARLLVPHGGMVEPTLHCAVATGRMAIALLQGDSPKTLGEFASQVQSRLECLPSAPTMTTQLALAASTLLPWLQMSRNVAGAQALHARMTDALQQVSSQDAAARYLLGNWLGAWALHLHFVDRARFPDALLEVDNFLAQITQQPLQFQRGRLITEHALLHHLAEESERGLHAMLAALHPQRPMQRVIYNCVALVAAQTRNDMAAAAFHIEHMQHDLLAADCPPSLAGLYQLKIATFHLAKLDYARAAATYAQCAEHANAIHAETIRGYSTLAHALHVYNDSIDRESIHHDRLFELLRDGLAAMRRLPSPNFFFSVPPARSAICALAFRKGIETEFVASALKAFPVAPPDWVDEHWPWAMALRCLGRFSNSAKLAEGQVAGKATSRPLHLLMMIAAHGAQGVPVNVAMDCLWPGQDGGQAEHSLTMTLVRLRRLYVDDDLIERDHGWLRLSATKVWTDVRAFESLLESMTGAQQITTEADRKRQISRLFDLYRGDCLAGVDDAWARERSAHYRARVMMVLQLVLRDATTNDQKTIVELVVSKAIERGIDLAPMILAAPNNDYAKYILSMLEQQS